MKHGETLCSPLACGFGCRHCTLPRGENCGFGHTLTHVTQNDKRQGHATQYSMPLSATQTQAEYVK